MSISFRCATCGEGYLVDDDLGGKRIRCRECQAWNRVAVVRSSEKMAPIPRAATSSFTFTQGILVGAFLMCVTSGVGLWLGLSSRESKTTPPVISSPPPAASTQQPPTPAPTVESAQAMIEPRRDAEEEGREKQQAAETELLRQVQLLTQMMQKQKEALESQLQPEGLQAQRPKSEAEKAEEEYQQKVQAELGSMSEVDQQKVVSIGRKLQAKQAINFSEFTFMRNHMVLFERYQPALDAIRNLANSLGFAEFCKNLEIDEKKFPLFASDWLADLGYQNCRTAVTISGLIRDGGVDNLPANYKRFIQAHPVSFASILR